MAATVFKHPKADAVKEIWAIKTVKGTLLTPMDDDGCMSFMAFPTEADAERAARSQFDRGLLDDDQATVVRLL